MTNGEGMMPFSRGFMLFAQRLPVVPVALRAGLPWGLHTHTLTSSFAANMFWFCFAPWVRLDAVVLQPMQFCEVRSLARRCAQVLLDTTLQLLQAHPILSGTCNVGVTGANAPQHSVQCKLARLPASLWFVSQSVSLRGTQT